MAHHIHGIRNITDHCQKNCHNLNLQYEVQLLLIFGARILHIIEGYRDEAADTPVYQLKDKNINFS